MRSKAHFKGHPIHMILVGFPIAFLSGSLIFDAAGWFFDWPSGWTTGGFLNLAAIISGLIAAVPGLIDFVYVVPPDSSARTRAIQHMLINVLALSLFGVSWVFRDLSTFAPGIGTLLLEAAGVGLVSWGGWLGGTLVVRNQIGVDHRYAQAGKWQERWIEESPGKPVVVAAEKDLEVNQMMLIHLGDHRVVLARTEQGFAAFDDRCTHRGGPLSDGVLICGTVQCPWHGGHFDVHSGAARSGPPTQSIRTYHVESINGEIRLSTPASK